MSRNACLAVLAIAFSTLSASAARAGLTYFLVAERNAPAHHGDSFVVPIERPDLVAHARDLIARGPEAAGASIVFADIAPGSGGGINRDLIAAGKPEWNWHATAVTGFGDMGIELIDGWPGYVDGHLDNWLRETGGTIGFWSYTVVKELPGYGGGGAQPPAVPLPPAAWAGGLTMIGLIVGRWRKAGRAR